MNNVKFLRKMGIKLTLTIIKSLLKFLGYIIRYNILENLTFAEHTEGSRNKGKYRITYQTDTRGRGCKGISIAKSGKLGWEHN